LARGQRLVYVPQAHRGERPVIPDERRDVHDRTNRDEVKKPPETSLAVGVSELAGDGPGELPGYPHPGQRIVRVPQLRVEDRGLRWVLGRDVMVRHDHVHPQLVRQRYLVLVRDAAVGGYEEVYALGEEVPYVGLEQAISHLPNWELDDHILRVVRERDVQNGGGGDAVGVVVTEDAYPLPIPHGPRDPAGRFPPRLLLRHTDRFQRRG
jgi:hypothetical protein